MKVYVFRTKSHKCIGGFTQDKTGANLPNNYGKWSLDNELEINENSSLIGASPKEIISDIEKQGYSIQEAKIEFKEII